ncbi:MULTISPECIES: DNA cytosine methyltransferase [unclassified Lysobacter]|uniref:DNA cytosine methyltransferase n=1 Tax=unclassified Lysobacter TaxID=2635362 RepID=UPI001BE50890|nr:MULTISPECIES: DNA cytosine methyltransferase [unclassified Lysobacter]MBT2746187.1 DNA cytosine methyltransferase [Lysobacter sp. ISL-42]MBT2750732.1 DNA cytosine methyltransferase [Lysobacter sp. ISL-50]MBT2776121.1 DNA cytosine methyltransferase [Lysobacter sp. ISL-54]MBT2784627.1 DNA cytosine methyltransferase [Lysobacter sp. ISL-52]
MIRAAYYNENDLYLCDWLRNLIAAGLIPPGDVDDRDIRLVSADDLHGYRQCHFFAGVGGFAYACRLAGWPDDAEIWTGGFPCQPFSVAGRQRAQADDRHLWPELHRLIASARPAAFLGENVAGIVPLALDGVLSDLEGEGYASRAVVVPACAVNAPHGRGRVWIVGRRLADGDGDGERSGKARQLCGRAAQWPAGGGEGGLEHAARERRGEGRAGPALRQWSDVTAAGTSGVGDADDAGSQGRVEHWQRTGQWAAWATGRTLAGRRIPESGIRLLAHGIPARIPRLRAAGNAIVPQVAAEILRALRS